MNQKQYTITINGVSESISQIDALLAKLNEIENRLKNINTSSLNTSSAKQTSSATGTEVKQQEEVAQATRTTAEENQRNLEALVGINRQLAENTNLQKEAMEIADRILGSNQQLHEVNEQYKKDLEAIKLDRKEIDALEKYGQISAEEALERRTQLSQKEMEIKTARQQNLVILRNEQKLLTAEEGSYEQISYTLSRLKEALKQVNAGNLSPEDFQKLAGAIDETDKKAKAMAASMGEFQRNVGNYPSAFEGIEGLKIKIGETEAEFGNAREAMRALRNAMTELALEGKTDTEQFHQYEEALKGIQMASIKVSDSIDRAKDASSGLHDVIEMFEGVASITAVGQGVSNLFGIDDGEIQKKIQQMTSLIAVMNGLQKLSTQMATGTGIGPALKKLFDTAGSNPVEMFKNVRDQLKGMFADSEATSRGFLKMGNVMNNLKSIGSGLWKGLVGGLATGGVMLAIDAAISGFQTLFSAIGDWLSSEDDAERAMSSYSTSVKVQNDALKEQIQLIEQRAKLEDKGAIETEQDKLDATTKSLEDYATVLKSTLALQNERVESFAKMNGFGNADFKGEQESIEELNAEVVRLNEEMSKGEDVQEELQGASSRLANAVMANFLKIDKSSEEAVNGFAEMVDGLDGVKIALDKLDQDDTYFGGIRQALLDMVNRVHEAQQAFYSLRLAMHDADRSVADAITDAAVNAIEDKTVRAVAQLEVARQRAIDEAKRQAKDRKLSKQATEEWIADINKAYDRQQKEATQSDKKTGASATNLRKTRVNEAERTARELAQIEKQIALDKINAMRDGLTKSLELIKREREERLKSLEKFKGTDKYNTLVEDTNGIFDDKEAKARLEYVKSYGKAIDDLNSKIRDLNHETADAEIELDGLRHANSTFAVEESERMRTLSDNLEDAVDKYDQLYKLIGKVSEQQDIVTALKNNGTEPELLAIHEAEFKKSATELFDLMDELMNTEVVADKQKESLELWIKYYRSVYQTQQQNLDKELELAKDSINERFSYEEQKLKERLDNELEALDEYYRNLVDDEDALKELGKTREEVTEDWSKKEEAIIDGHIKLILANNEKKNEELRKTDNEYNEKRLSDAENFYDNMFAEVEKYSNHILNKASELEKRSTNAWGIIDIKKLKKEKAEAVKEIDALVKQLRSTQVVMRAISKALNLPPDAFKKLNDEIDGMIEKLKQGKKEVKDIDIAGAFISSINTYIQEVGNAISSIMSSLYDYNESVLDAQEELLDDEIDLLEAKLSEQEEITRKHKEAMDEIENELQTARGDRRDALIDQLNAEVSAQRASLASEKRMQKEKEALEDKKDALDLKRKKMQQQQSKTQAKISTALAIANGLATQPFVPVGIAMGALAAAMGAVQIATIANQKFASGGKIEGASHARGGVQIEAEGGEYVINRNAYSRNAELVELINNAGRRLTLSDIASAGYDFPASIETRGNEPIVVSSDQPIFVSVVDINNAQDRLVKVKEMAR